MDTYVGIWSWLWDTMYKFAGVPFILYGGPEQLLHEHMGFLFFSGDHVWWHTVLLAIFWITLFIVVYGAVFMLIGAQIGRQLDAAEDDYDVPLFNMPIMLLYVLGLIFPFMVASDWFYFKPWAAWFAFCFPALVWIYYIVKTGLAAFILILRQLYVVFLILICVTILILPAFIGFVILVACAGFEEGAKGGMYIWVRRDY